MSNMCDLPDDLVAEVLARVKDKKVPRLKCVSKSWKTLIESPEFIHMRRQRIPQFLYLSWEYDRFYTMEIMDRDQNLNSKKKKKIRRQQKTNKVFVGSCNGVLCQIDYKSKNIELHNPCTKQRVRFPLDSNLIHLSFGFGYDNVHDDYKVAALTAGTDFDIHKAVVYSLRSKSSSWIDFKISDSYVSGMNTGVFANGALHWIINTNIVAIDLATESYHLVALPSPKQHVGCFGEVDGCLTLLTCRAEYDYGIGRWIHERYDMWIMKEYGVQDSWTKLCLLPPNDSMHGILKRNFDRYTEREKNLLRCNFGIARSVIEPGMMESIDFMAFRIQGNSTSHNAVREEDDLILWYPKKWKGVYTFTPNFFNLPTQD